MDFFIKMQLHQLNTIFLLLQVAVKNNIGVFYFTCLVPMHVLFGEDGNMDKKVFLNTWKEIPTTNEVQSTIGNVQHSAGKSSEGQEKYLRELSITL
jgi:hypothetical protein